MNRRCPTLALGLVVVCCVAVSRAVGAEEPSSLACEQKKINTADAGVVGIGDWEVQLTLSRTAAHRAFSNSGRAVSRDGAMRQLDASLSITTGIFPDVQIGVTAGLANVYDASSSPRRGTGLTDLNVQAQWLFAQDEQARWLAALAAGFTAPLDRSLDKRRLGITQDYPSLDAALILTKDFGERWTATGDLGYSLPFGEHRGDARGALSANGAIGYHITEWLQPELEFNYSHEFFSRGPGVDVYAATAGLVICLREDLLVMAGVQRTLAGRNTDRATAFIISAQWSFGRSYGAKAP